LRRLVFSFLLFRRHADPVGQVLRPDPDTPRRFCLPIVRGTMSRCASEMLEGEGKPKMTLGDGLQDWQMRSTRGGLAPRKSANRARGKTEGCAGSADPYWGGAGAGARHVFDCRHDCENNCDGKHHRKCCKDKTRDHLTRPYSNNDLLNHIAGAFVPSVPWRHMDRTGRLGATRKF
jgi:hypothetical protein